MVIAVLTGLVFQDITRTLYSGVAGGADAILIPEIPYDIKKVAKVVEARAKSNKGFTILAVAEGAMDKEEAKLKKKEREAKRAAEHFSASAYVAQQLRELVGVEARNVVPGHIQRGGDPTARDRVAATKMGYLAVELLKQNLTNRIQRALKDEILLTPHVKLLPKGTLPVSEGKAVRVVDKRTVYQ